jgi:hypothetical protein
MFDHSNSSASASGIATVSNFPNTSDRIMVSCKKITVGTGTVTLTARVGNDTAYTSITDGTIDLTAPIGVIIEGRFTSIKGTSSSGSDVYELEVVS